MDHLLDMLPHWTTLAKILAALVAVALFFIATTLVGVAVDAPARALASYAASFGLIGPVVGLTVLIGSGVIFTRWSMRRDERRQIAATGIIDVPQPPDTRLARKAVFWISLPIWIVAAVLFVIVLMDATGLLRL